jgi:hypothetical protein
LWQDAARGEGGIAPGALGAGLASIAAGLPGEEKGCCAEAAAAITIVPAIAAIAVKIPLEEAGIKVPDSCPNPSPA